MPSTTLARGNMLLEMVLSVTLTPSSVAANTFSTQTFALPGALATDLIGIENANQQIANIIVQSAWVSAAGVGVVQFMNVSAAAVTPSSGTYIVNLMRPEYIPLPANLA